MRSIYISILLLASMAAMGQNSIGNIIQSVLANNMELKALQAESRATVLDMKAENNPGNPSIEYSPFFAKGQDGVATSELVVSEEFDFPTIYAQRRKETRLAQRTLEDEYKVRQRQIKIEALALCYDIIEQNQRISLLNERMEQSLHIAELYRKRMEAGDANVLEVNKATMERMQAAQDLAEAENQRRISMQQLQALNGNKAIELPDMTFPETKPLTANQPAALPTVASAESTLTASRHSERMAKNGWLPSVTVGYRRNTEDEKSLNGFLVGMSFNLFGTGAKAKAATQRREAAELRLEQARIDAEQQQHAQYDQLMKLQTVMDHSNVELLRETLTLLDKALQHGEINVLNYYAEYNALYDKLIQHIAIHCQYMKLHAELFEEAE